MNRREALSAVTILFGGTIIGAEAFLSGCTSIPEKKQVGVLDTDDIGFLNNIAEVILPATPSSPGAKHANVGEFMNVIVTDCYTANQQSAFKNGIVTIHQLSAQHFEDNFSSLSEDKKHALIMMLEREAKDHSINKASKMDVHYYTMIKQLAIWSFLSSEVGITQAMRHTSVPGRYEGCIPLETGGKVWA